MTREAFFSEGRGLRARMARPDASRGKVQKPSFSRRQARPLDT